MFHGIWSETVSLPGTDLAMTYPVSDYGIAVRLATEMQLHCAYRGAIAGDRVSYVAARLYYLVHVCNHQFSIAYGVSCSHLWSNAKLTGSSETSLDW